MKILIISSLLSALFLSSCSSLVINVKNKSSRQISIENILPNEKTKAYRMAEKHCAKYYKVPRKISSKSQPDNDDMTTIVFECVRPNR